MIRSMIFDMGQVLIRWSPQQLTERFCLTPEEDALLRREVFGNVEWVALDHGTLTEEAALASICRRLPEHLHPMARQLVCAWWEAPLVPMPGMEELLARLKKRGYGLYLLSNAGLPLRRYFSRIPGSRYFDGLLVSSEEKLLKPQKEIYQRLLEKFSLKPEECFFVDDSPANIEGALGCGIRGTVFHGDPERLLRELEQAGIL